MSRVYAIASAKGGVGKTTTTANLGTVLSMAGHDVVVVDGDLGMPNLAGALGVDPDGETLHDVLTGEVTVESATYEGPEALSVVPGSTALEAFASANAKQLHPVIETLKETHDIVLVDTGAGLSDDTFVPLKLADEVLLVSTTEREALGDTEKTRQLGERIGADVVGVVLTRVNQSNPNADEVASLLDAGVIAVVPEDPAIREALSTQVPVVARSPDSIAAAGYRALAEALTGEPVPVPERDDDEDAQADGHPAPGREPDAASDADTDDEVSVVQTDAPPESETTDDTPAANTPTADEPDDDAEAQSESPSDPSADADESPSPEPESVAERPSDAEETPDESVTESVEEQTPETDAAEGETPETDAAEGENPEADPTEEHAQETDAVEEEPQDSGSVEAESHDAEPASAPASDAEPDTSPKSSGTDDVDTDAAAEQTLEAEAEAKLDAEADSMDGAIPFGGDASASDPDDPLAGESFAGDDPVTADLNDAESMGPDPLAGDAVDEATSEGVTASVDTSNADDTSPDAEAATRSEPATEDHTAPAGRGRDEEPTQSSGETPVVEAASSGDADEPLVAEAEPDAAETADQSSADSADEHDGEEEGVYTTSLVEEVESLEDEEEDDGKKGFLSRFLG